MNVELLHIHKQFGAVRANDDVSITFAPGAIHGLLGENGAGKSTLMKILSGFQPPDAGEILLDGTAAITTPPAQAIARGVGMLHQDPLDFPPLRVAENFQLGLHPQFLLTPARARRELREIAARFDFDLDPDAPVARLSVGERQQLEIARLLARGARVLILDEPTTGISASQKTKLFAALTRLAQDGMTIIFVSHKLADVQTLCDRVTVLRRGQVAGEMQKPLNDQQLVQMMFGKALTALRKPVMTLGENILELENIAIDDQRLSLSGVSLAVRAGEVIGLAGLEGSGQRPFLRVAAGLDAPRAGSVRLAGKAMTRQSYLEFRAQGVAYLPAARLEEGLVAGLSLAEHFILADKARGVFIDANAAHADAARGIAVFQIRGAPATRVENLSGGNQQRALLALLPRSLKLLLMEHPTRGLDVESTAWVWERLLERRAHGTAIVFASSDLDEILERSDRILVFSGGNVTRALTTSETSVAQLGELIGGRSL